MARKILHLDLDAFFCAVEEKFDPSLKNLPFATGGSAEGRGVVTSCSYAARQYGIHSAMPMQLALRLYPHLIVKSGNYREYTNHSKQVMKILRNYTPLVEQISIDEAFLDLTDLSAEPYSIAVDIQSKILSKLELPSSIGAATNKLVAKIATNIGKSTHKGFSYPMAIKVIEPGKEEQFLAPLPVSEMWGIGPKSAIVLNRLGIKIIGDIVRAPLNVLEKHFGKFTNELIRRSKGIDERPVGDFDGIKSISNEITFFQDICDIGQLYIYIKFLSEKVAHRLRKRRLSGKTIKIKIRFTGFETHTHQVTLDQPTNQESIINSAANELFHEIWGKGKKVRLIGVGVSSLCQEFQQLSLFNENYLNEKRLLAAIDQIRAKFGDEVIKKGMERHYFRSWKN